MASQSSGTSTASSRLSIDGFLERSHTALTNARTPEIAPLLAPRGISMTDMDAKLTQVAALRALQEAQKREYGEQYQSTEAYNQAVAAVHETYMDHVRLARIVFKNDTAAKTALGLNDKRARSQSGYASQGLQFYNNAKTPGAYAAALAQRGVTAKEVKEGQEAFENLQVLTAAQQKETGEAQQATATRDEAYDELSEWMSDFYEVARVALRKHPQLIEKLGIRDRS